MSENLSSVRLHLSSSFEVCGFVAGLQIIVSGVEHSDWNWSVEGVGRRSRVSGSGFGVEVLMVSHCFEDQDTRINVRSLFK